MRDWLIQIRREANMTQACVAHSAGISQTYYAQIESGQRGKALRVEIAKRIAKVLCFDWNLFYDEENAT